MKALDHNFVINLDRRRDRLERFQKRIARFGFQFTRFAAVDAQSRQSEWGSPPPQVAAEFACWLSHLGVWSQALELGLSHFTVFEDDACFDEGFREKVDDYCAQLPSDWQIVHFGPSYLEPPVVYSKNLRRLRVSYCTHGYALQGRDFVARLRDELARQLRDAIALTAQGRSTKTAIDHALGPMYCGIRAYSFVPGILWQEEGFSDIRQAFNYDNRLRAGEESPTPERACVDPAPRLQDDSRQTRHASTHSLADRVWQAVSSLDEVDPSLRDDLLRELSGDTRGRCRYWLGLIDANSRSPDWSTVASWFQSAWQFDPSHFLAGHALACVLDTMGQREFAIEQCLRVLTAMERWSGDDAELLRSPPFSSASDTLRVAWEQAAGSESDPAAELATKRVALRCELHLLLSRLTGDVSHAFQANALRPDLSCGRLGNFLSLMGRHFEAIGPLSRAVADDPFDCESARSLEKSLLSTGRFEDRDALVASRQSLARAAPGRISVEEWFRPVEPRPRPTAGRRHQIVWQGTIDRVHSLAHVNRELVKRLSARGHQVATRPSPFREGAASEVSLPVEIERCQRVRIDRPDVHVRHHWPPDWTPPTSGHWVVIQPWEFGAIPADWLRPLEMVDEIWVPSRFVRNSYIGSGVPADKVVVVPNGIDLDTTDRPRASLALPTKKRFKFLFVGGTIERKGIDALLKAYVQAFDATDDACLVVKDCGVGGVYGGQTAEKQIAHLRSMPSMPEILYLNEDLTEGELAALFHTCDCLVHPFRGEGFALPIAEAMAHGLPVIVTGFGPALDYCDSRTAFLIPATVKYFSEDRIGDLQTAGTPFVVEPDSDALRYSMRYVYRHPTRAKQIGEKAREYVRANLTWDQSVDLIEDRLDRLANKSIARTRSAS